MLKKKVGTWKLPWIKLVQIDFFDDGSSNGVSSTLGTQVVVHEFIVSGVESKPGW